MKNTFVLSIIAVCCLFFMGCPYESEVGIDSTPAVKIDTRLIGTWKKGSSEDASYIVTKESENMYKIEERRKSAEKSSIYHAYLSNVKGTIFMNAKEEDGLSSNYSLYKVIINSPTSVSLMALTENITEKFRTSAELKAFIEKNMGLSFFFDKSIDDFTKE